MESLARLVAIILLTIVLLGVIAFVVVLRPPHNIFARIVVGVLTTFGAFSGLWLAMLEIGIGARLIGVAVAVVSIKALLAVARPKSQSR